jgi:pimeloyl-ACP methyl ester carboxylesterase
MRHQNPRFEYAGVGPSTGRAIILLHGWPHDVHSYVGVASLLGSAGCRVIVPYLARLVHGMFLSDGTVSEWPAPGARYHVVALMDVLRIDQRVLAGLDWGAHTPIVA